MKDMKALRTRLGLLLERINHLSLRERAMVFGAGVALLGMGWQMLLMDPLARRAGAPRRRCPATARGAPPTPAGGRNCCQFGGTESGARGCRAQPCTGAAPGAARC